MNWKVIDRKVQIFHTSTSSAFDGSLGSSYQILIKISGASKRVFLGYYVALTRWWRVFR